MPWKVYPGFSSPRMTYSPIQSDDEGGPGVESFLRPLHVNNLYPNDLSLLSEPFQVFDFDFQEPLPDTGRERLLQASLSSPTDPSFSSDRIEFMHFSNLVALQAH